MPDNNLGSNSWEDLIREAQKSEQQYNSEEEVNAAITTLVRMTKVFYDQCIQLSFPPETAVQLTQVFLAHALKGGKG